MALVVTGGLATSPAASADPISSCTASTGTVVAVDFRHWGGPVVRGCGVDSSSGYLLLHDGGFTTAGDAHDGPAFICRIGNAAFGGGAQYPTSKDDACIKTPSASAYWSFWLAPKGQDTWSYSQLGAMSDKPKPGEVELWQFGGTDVAGTSGRPTMSPAALRATGTRAAGGGAGSSSKPTHGGSSRSTARAGGGVATSPRSAGVHAGTGARSAGSASATGSHTAAPTSASRGVVTPAPSSGVTAAGSSSVASASPPIVDASAVAGSGTSSSAGSPWPVILGVALVLLLGGAGGLGVLRRRRADAAEH